MGEEEEEEDDEEDNEDEEQDVEEGMKLYNFFCSFARFYFKF